MSLLDDRRVPIADPQLGAREQERVAAVIESGDLADGEPVRAFEREFADYCGTEHGVATANGTAALHAALEACGIDDGDTVLTTPFSFVASANAIRFTGAEPVFADIDPETYNLDPDAVRERVAERDGDVDAIVAVHLYGLPAPMDELASIADECDAALVEDAAQAHGATYEGKPVGSLGDVAAFSFYPTKNMTTGEGGMILTDRDDVAEQAARFVNHGRDDQYDHVDVGHNFRMTSMAGAIGRVQLDRLDEFVEARRQHADRLTEAVAETPLTAPASPSYATHSYHQFTVRAPDRAAFVDHMDDAGIDTGVYYPTPIHEQPAYDGVDAEAPVAERAADEVVSLPVHPGLTDGDVEAIATALERYDA